jgi:hypothetical protein
MYADMPDINDYHKNNKHLDYWQRNIPFYTRTLRVRPEDRRPWSQPQDGEVSVFPRFSWWHYLLAIESFDANEQLLRLGPGSFYEIRGGDRYFVRGIFEELDSPGEWYLDYKTATLYFWPPSPIGNKPVYAAVARTIVDMNNCAYVTFRGFTIECSENTAVKIKNCSNCLVAASVIRNVGDYEGDAVKVDGGHDNGIVGNDIYGIGAYGISMSGGDINDLTMARNYAENNYIHHVGVIGRYAKAIEITGCGNRISHNLMHDIPQSGILMWGNKHTIEYNHIRHTCLEGQDTGAIGGGNIDWLSWYDVNIRYNIIQDTLGFGYDSDANEWRSPHFVWALYPDWAASDVKIIGNIIVRAPLGLLHLHSGRNNLVENNILIDGSAHQIYLSGWNTTIGYWATMVDGWIKNYERASKFPAWKKIPSFKDPRSVPLADGRLMYGNVVQKNILCYRDPNAIMILARQLPEKNNKINKNLIFHYGQPLHTGQVSLKKEIGPNLISNPGLEEGLASELSKIWPQISQNDPRFESKVVSDEVHSGKNCFMIDSHQPMPEDRVVKPLYVYIGSPVPYAPGKAYRLSLWLKGQNKSSSVELLAYSWEIQRTIRVTDKWQPFDFVFKIPADSHITAVSKVKTFTPRLILPQLAGKFWVDDISVKQAEVADEWTSWKDLGFDTESIIADPLFVDPRHDDYQLQPDSPAFKIGFQQIPVKQIGPYQDSMRASWPIVEAIGIREAQLKSQTVWKP